MKNIILIMLLTASVMASSCKEENVGTADNIDAVIDFFVLDENGNDLIEQSIIKEERMTVYHQQPDGQYKVYYQSNLADPKGVSISEAVKYGYDKYSMKLFPSFPVKDNTSSTIIDWGIEGFKKDTFDCVFTEKERNLYLTEVKLNGEPFYNSSSNIALEIIKTME